MDPMNDVVLPTDDALAQAAVTIRLKPTGGGDPVVASSARKTSAIGWGQRFRAIRSSITGGASPLTRHLACHR